MSEYINLLDVITKDRTLPEGADRWGLKSVSPGLTTHGDYSWLPAIRSGIAEAALVNEDNDDACPAHEGDGLCVGLTWRGMASGGIPARTLLLVAYADADVLGVDELAGKLRVRKLHVVDVINGEILVRRAGARANLRGANLRGANLRGANLYGADLSGANLSRADLYGANLHWADLYGANLHWADLYGADLSGANLSRADLSGANLHGADLSRADLSRADLYGANLHGANLHGANLSGANLHGADLHGANLHGADLHGADLSGAVGLPDQSTAGYIR